MVKTGKQHIFVVDDDRAICASILETLDETGAKVSTFTCASDCLEQLRSRKCDLLITDLNMPDIDGIELLRRAKTHFPELPVLMMTGHGSVPAAVEAIKLGAADFIEKPLVKKDFLRLVQALLEENNFADTNLDLSHAETKVLKMVLACRSNKEIAAVLKCSQEIVEKHRAHLMEKIGVENLVDLVRWAVITGYIDLPAEPGPDESQHQ